MEPNHIYQYSLLNALMAGLSTGGLPASTLLSRGGNQGLGTFARMDGELLFLDGTIYRLSASSGVTRASPDSLIPFAVTTSFVPQERKTVHLRSKHCIDAALAAFAPGKRNLFVTYRIVGRFARVKCRLVRGQRYEGQSLAELGEEQRVDELLGVEGTVVGFRTPENWQGFGVAGEHLHFISSDGGRGGHVLEISTEGEGDGKGDGGKEGEGEGVEMQMAVARHVHVELPGDEMEEFGDAELRTDDEGVRKVEG